MAVSTPDWLAQRDGRLMESKDGFSYVVFLGPAPQYLVMPIPAGGKHACRVTQTVNGKRLDAGATFATFDDAVRGGLHDLRKALGWQVGA